MMKKYLFIVISAVFALGTFAQGPNGSNTYYKNADGLCGEELKTAMSKIITNGHSVKSYSSLDQYYQYTDKRADGLLRDWYDNTTNYSLNGGGWNKEHLVPQSWFKEASPMKSDIVHVVPTNSSSNSDRGDKPLAEVGQKSLKCTTTYCIFGTCKTPGYTGAVYEPNDEIKGDIARIYFYMATRYEDVILNWKGNKDNSETAAAVIDHNGGSKYKPFKQWYMNMLLRWAKEDPVNEIEIARNNGVKQVQNNRNPFVDYPGLEDYIWGDKVDVPFSYDDYDSDVTYIARPTFESTTNEDGTVTVTISSADDAIIYYTTDGSDPTIDSKLYSGPIELTETTIVKAISVTSEGQSGVAEQKFTVKQGGDTPPVGDGSYVRVNSTDELVSGANYLIVYEESSSHGYAMATTADKAENNEEVEISDETIEKGSLPLVLTQLSNGCWTICTSGDIYLAHSSAKNNIETTSTDGNATAQWSISISGGNASIVNKQTSYAIQFNKNNDQMRFRCYKQNTQQPVALYIQTGEGSSETDDINGLTTELQNGQPMYNLKGQRVKRPGKGIYIKNRKKIIIN